MRTYPNLHSLSATKIYTRPRLNQGMAHHGLPPTEFQLVTHAEYSQSFNKNCYRSKLNAYVSFSALCAHIRSHAQS
ncbi:hypothetical protein BDW67DRAFT_118455 [Aspergillus spinulosporus]